MARFTPETSALGESKPTEPARRAQRGMTISALAIALKADTEAVARRLLGEPNQKLSNRREQRWGGKGAIRVHIAGPRKGTWHDEAAGEKGDMLNLAVRELGGKDAAYEWARRWCGGDGTATAPTYVPKPVDPERTAREAAGEAAQVAVKRAAALALWERGKPIIGTQTERYLTARELKVPPGCSAIRHLDSVKNSDGKAYSAMMAVLTKSEGTFCGIQLTFLCRSGEPRKAADARHDRETRAPMEDGAVWLTPPGAHSRVVVGEGVESVLSARLADPTMGAVAVLSTRYASVAMPPPDQVPAIVIAVDVDLLNPKTGYRPGERAARTAAADWADASHNVCLAFPGPPNGPMCDFNDLLQADGVAAVRAALEAAEVIPSPARQSLRERVVALCMSARMPLPRNVREAGRTP